MVVAMTAAAATFTMTMASAASAGFNSCAHDNQFTIDFVNDQVIQSISGRFGDHKTDLVEDFRSIVFIKNGKLEHRGFAAAGFVNANQQTICFVFGKQIFQSVSGRIGNFHGVVPPFWYESILKDFAADA